MKGDRCMWGCGNPCHNYVCVDKPTEEHSRTVLMLVEMQRRASVAEQSVTELRRALVSAHEKMSTYGNALKRRIADLEVRLINRGQIP